MFAACTIVVSLLELQCSFFLFIQNNASSLIAFGYFFLSNEGKGIKGAKISIEYIIKRMNVDILN
jgi:hypothetical protein